MRLVPASLSGRIVALTLLAAWPAGVSAASGTDAKVLAGAISSFAREGRRMVVTGIGAASINQVSRGCPAMSRLTRSQER